MSFKGLQLQLHRNSQPLFDPHDSKLCAVWPLRQMPYFRRLFRSIFLCWSLAPSLAELQTITVDDTNGDAISRAKPTYQPDIWALGQDCPGCAAQPNASLAFDGTWHDTTHSPRHAGQRSAIVRFGGIAVSAFFITANNLGQPGVASITNLTFTIDGELVGNFTHEPGPNDDYNYNVLGYSNSSLENTFHELVISTTGDASLVLFDYLTYTFDTADIPINTFTSLTLPALSVPTGSSQPATPSPSHSFQPSSSRGMTTGAIIGLVLAGLIAFISALVLFLYRRRRLQRDASQWKTDESVLSGIPVASSQDMATVQERQHYSGGIPEKGIRIQMDEIQVRIERLRNRVAQIDTMEESEGTHTTLRPSESASRLFDPRLRAQLVELQAQITTLEEERRRVLGQITQ